MTMQKRIYLNDNWYFTGDDNNKVLVSIPHTVKEIPYNYFDQNIYQFISTYEKELNIDDETKNLILTFEGVGHSSSVFLNDTLIGKHDGGYDKFSYNLKGYAKKGVNNLKVVVNSKEDINCPPFGNVIDYLTYGGIYRDVYLDVCEEAYIKDVFVKPNHESNWYIDVTTTLSKSASYEIEISFNGTVIENKKVENNLLISDTRIEFRNPNLWDIETPNLYDIKVKLENGDTYTDKFGLRTVKFKTDGFYLNGKKVRIVGLNRHQSYPYIGYAAPKSLQVQDADILKYELGVNAVRTSHYMQSKHFIDECDRIGLLVFTESPGWQYIGDKAWKELAIENMKKMVLDYRNHPSIILWGARINESPDDHDFYLEANKVIRELDPTRQTGGVRCITKSEELEDVYTYNNFVTDYDKGLTDKKYVTKSKDIPYLVSEYNGHMFPTKTFDDDIHLEKDALNIARGLNVLFEDDSRAGMFIWCMFDYNTHKDFGSGDKICYHGVLDMFRNPKPAGYLFASLGGIDTLHITSLMRHGDYPVSNIYQLYAFTNADKIKLFKNGDFVKEYTHKDTKYPNLKNAPILIDDLVGDQLVKYEGYDKKTSEKMKEVLQATLKYGNKLPLKYKLKFLNLVLFHHITYEKGYQLYGKYIGGWGDTETIFSVEAYKGDKLVKSVTLGDPKTLHLDVNVTDTNLHEENSYDARLIRIKVLDQNNNLAHYYQEGFEVKAEGPIEIVGPSILSFKGGMTGTIIKTTHKTGKAKLIIKTQFETKEIEFNIE